jgi:hypothetical protein
LEMSYELSIQLELSKSVHGNCVYTEFGMFPVLQV